MPPTPQQLTRGSSVVALAMGSALLLGACQGAEALDGVLEMSGDVGSPDDPTHDPAVLRHDDTYYVFSTGQLRSTDDPGGIWVRRSTETLEGPWESLGELPVPAWTERYGPAHLWAPQVVMHGGTVHLYFAASSFGSNHSAIGLLTTSTPEDPASWEDEGEVLTSRQTDRFNAIDGHVFEADGSWWIAFGSHWDGIFLQELEDLRRPVGDPHHLASRPGVQHNPIEAPTIVEHDGAYYLFTSWDRCCAGVLSTYRVAVGRADEVTGPYVDRGGRPLLDGGGTILLDADGDQLGPGGQDVFVDDDGAHYLVHHYYDAATNGTIRLQIRRIDWEDGWPSVARIDASPPADAAPPTDALD